MSGTDSLDLRSVSKLYGPTNRWALPFIHLDGVGDNIVFCREDHLLFFPYLKFVPFPNVYRSYI